MRFLQLMSIATLLACSASSSEPIEPEFGGPGLQAKADGFSELETSILEFGGDASGEFTRDFQFFAFEFRTIADAVISAEVTQSGTSRGLDTTMFIYRLSETDAPQRIAFDDDDGWGQLSRISDFRIFADGNYAVVVGTAGAEGRGSFRLTLGCTNGACEPAAPIGGDCPSEIQAGLIECIEFASYENDYEIEVFEAASECHNGGQTQTIFENICYVRAGSSWCSDAARDNGARVISSCGAFLAASYPSASGVRLDPVRTASLEALEDAAHESDNCTVSQDAGCQVQATAYSYTGAAPSMAQLIAFARTTVEPGPGLFAKQTLDDLNAAASLADYYGITAELDAAARDVSIDFDEAAIGSARTDEFFQSGATCDGTAVVMHDAGQARVMIITSVFCAD